MRESDENNGLDPGSLPAQEGVFDDQLAFPLPFFEPLVSVRTVVKRDGRHVAFDVSKVADAIFRAAQAIGGRDRARAESLAAGVQIYLTKTVRCAVSTVDQVHDAVEKVLIEMGHARTALAYVRYRDRKARVRRLREGDGSGLLDEWAEARRGRGDASRDAAIPAVRTSRDTLVAWDRQAIVDALTRETGLDAAQAHLIALDVERQIAAADLTALTSPLIRELVSAKLLEHGLETHGRRNARLGVPAYDAARLICGPHDGDTPVDPCSTGLSIAEAVKHAFALDAVYCGKAAEAHMNGDIHLHGLGSVDRLHDSVQSLESVKRFGLAFPGLSSASHPARYPDTLLAHMVHMQRCLNRHFAGRTTWEAFNVYFAPFLQGLSNKALRQAAQMVVYEFAHQTPGQFPRTLPVELGICWDVPAYLRGAEAIGPGGEPAGRTYAECMHAAQQFAWALLEVIKEGGPGGQTFPAPDVTLSITPEFFASPGNETFLEQVAEVAVRRGHIQVQFERQRQRDIDPATLRQARCVAAHCVTLNLPRVAYRSANLNEFLRHVDAVAETVVRAHLDKRAFIRSLLERKSLGPLGFLTSERGGRAWLDFDSAAYLVGVAGLNECVQALTGHELHASEKAVQAGARIAEHLSARFDQYGEDHDIDFTLGQTACRETLRRLADLDLRDFPERARQTVKTDPVSQEIFYTAGAQLNDAIECSPMERVRIEGYFHEWFPSGACTWVRLPDDDTARGSVAAFTKMAHQQTQARRIAFREPAASGT